MKHSEIEAMVKGLAPVVRDYIADAFRPFADRLVDLEERVAKAERKGLAYAGTWQRAAEYARGTVVTHNGSAWVALRAVPSGLKPGDTVEHWQLMVKAGRDAR